MRLAGKVAFITGASRGIGHAIALAFAKEGATIGVGYANRRDKADETVAEIVKLGGKAAAFQIEVTDRATVRKAFADTAAQFGGIDILVNNAGVNNRCTFMETTDEDWDRIMGVNLKGPFVCCQEVFPHLIARKGGRIVNISSVAGQYHGPKTVHYAVSKAGLNSLTAVVARYGAEHNILVNAVAPGIMWTEQTADELAGPDGDRIVSMTLVKRAGQLSDVAATCVWLASDEQSYVTGQVISVSGGAVLP